MDLLLRYWDNHDQQVKVRYWDSKFLGHTTNKDLLIEFNKSVDIIDLSKIIQVSMDGPSVNLKFMQELIKHREELEMMIDIGTCGLHVVHGAFKCGIESTEWKIKETLKSSHQLLHDTPARRVDYVSVTQSSEYPLFFCATRSVEDKKKFQIDSCAYGQTLLKSLTFGNLYPKANNHQAKVFKM